MDTLYEEHDYRGYRIEIHRDENPIDPRTDCNLGTMYTAHRHMCLEKKFDQHFEFEEVIGERFSFLPSFLKEYIALPIYMYDHSGQTIRTTPFSCPWDSGWLGMITVPIEDVKKEYGWKNLTAKRREQIEGYLKTEVEVCDDYMAGEVYGYQIFDPQDEEIDACWNFIGSDAPKEMTKECKEFIDGEIGRNLIKNLKAGIQQILPFPDISLCSLNPTLL